MNISIVIITKDRADFMDTCLTSLKGQLSRGDEVLVIMDSQTRDGTENMLQNNRWRLPLTYCKSRVQGFSYNYNYGIRKSTKEIIVFIGDDCRVEKDFVRNIKKAHKMNNNTIIQGMSYSVPKGNIYAEIMGDNYQNWIILNTINTKPWQLKTIDNKNVSIPRSIFSRYGVYDNRFSQGAEDRAYGLILHRKGVRIFLDESIVAYHHERTTLKEIIHQHVRMAQSERVVDQSLPKEAMIHMIPFRKVTLHIHKAITREMLYLRRFQLKNFLLLPVVYFVLACVRVYSYAIKADVRSSG